MNKNEFEIQKAKAFIRVHLCDKSGKILCGTRQTRLEPIVLEFYTKDENLVSNCTKCPV